AFRGFVMVSVEPTLDDIVSRRPRAVQTAFAEGRIDDAARRGSTDAARRLHRSVCVAELRYVAGDALPEPVGAGFAPRHRDERWPAHDRRADDAHRSDPLEAGAQAPADAGRGGS